MFCVCNGALCLYKPSKNINAGAQNKLAEGNNTDKK